MAEAAVGRAEHHVRKGRALVCWQTMLVEDLSRRQNIEMLKSAYALLVQMRIALDLLESSMCCLGGQLDLVPPF